MPTLSSRPTQPEILSHEEVVEAAQASINIFSWLGTSMAFPDNTPRTVQAATGIVEDVLGCMMLADWAVQPIPGTVSHLYFDVAVKPYAEGPYVIFPVRFPIV